MHSPLLVGLDINFGSIGWAVLSFEDPEEPGPILAHGTWVFEAPMNPKSGDSLLKERGIARRIRRNRDRKKRRIVELRAKLIDNGLLPEDPKELWGLMHDHVRNCGGKEVENHPYALRARGLREPLTLHQLGRCILHIAIRRAYLDVGDLKWLKLARRRPGLAQEIRAKSLKSAAKASAETEVDEERRHVLGAIHRVESQLDGRTAGQFLNEVMAKGGRVRFTKKGKDSDRRGFLLSRWMLEDEFRKLWEIQRRFHPAELTDGLFTALDLCIFDQREIRQQKHLRNQCAVYDSHPAAAKASLWFQRFRIAQDLANLRMHCDGLVAPLDQARREVLFRALQTVPKMGVKLVKETLDKAGLPIPSKAALAYAFGDEERFELKGNESAVRIQTVPGARWDELEPPESYGGDNARQARNQANLVQDLVDLPPIVLYDRLTGFWNYGRDTALALMRARLPEGYGRYCTRLLRRAAPIMLVEGLDTQAAVDVVRGRPLPSSGEILASSGGKWDRVQSFAKSENPDLAKMRNHVVARCLRECRWLLRQIEEKYGRQISTVRIEVARDFGRSAEDRRKIELQQGKNRKERERLAKELEEAGVAPTRENVRKLQLLKEQASCFPVYGPPLPAPSIQDLDRCEIDHIVPRSKGGEPVNFENLVLTTTELNREKGDRTPWEAWGSDPERWQWLELSARKLADAKKAGKARRLLSKEVKEYAGDDFHFRALNDVRYATKEIMDVLRLVGYRVEAVPSRTTAALRDEFRHLDVFYRDQYPKAVEVPKEEKLRPEKNRDFHLHHAIDALTVAMCDRKTLKRYLDHMRELELHRAQRMVEVEEDGKKRRRPALIGWPAKVYAQLQNGAPPILVGRRPSEGGQGAWTKEGHVPFIHAKTKAGEDGAAGKTVPKWTEERMQEMEASLDRYLEEAARSGKPYRKAAPVLNGEFQAFFEFECGRRRITQIFPKAGNHHMTVWTREGSWRATVTSDLEVAHRRRVGRGDYDDAPPEQGWRMHRVLHSGDVVQIDGGGALYVVRSVSAGEGFEVSLTKLALSNIKKELNSLYVANDGLLYERIRSVKNLGRIGPALRVSPFGEATEVSDPLRR